METYKQNIKEDSREVIWEHSIKSLTERRLQSRILNPEYINNLWKFAFDDHLLKYNLVDIVNSKYLSDWHSFSDQTYGSKKADELKVAYLCGPEPENDLNHLIKLGVRIENIYAFESDKKYYNQALKSIKDNYPTLKIFHGKIDHFFKSSLIKFDIIYLDFTSSIMGRESKVYQTISILFENQALNNLSCLITNTCYPDKTDENIDFLSSYFHYQSCYDYLVYDSTNTDGEGRFVENNQAYGIDDIKDFKPIVKKNFDFAYSAFQTNFIINYSNLILPITNILSNPILFKRLFKADSKVILEELEKFEQNWSIYLEADRYSLFHFFQELINGKSPLSKAWSTFITENKYDRKSMNTAVKFFYMLLNAPNDGFMKILSDPMKLAISEIMNNIPDRIGGSQNGLFCDIPMIHLWLELSINQLGYVYHQNTENHRRYSYKAKERNMCIDIFTFDQCRSLYDWLPMIDYYGEDLKIIERQILTRMCVDAIGKQSYQILGNQYYGSAIACINDQPWSKNHFFKNRINLSDN